jgi:ATP-dependent helicase/nuclease subunit A
MSVARNIPDTVTIRQHEASDPSVSAWVSANAGAGKTYVLAQRVIRLLLDGTPPSKILCLTYTKAAAANMANRVFERLGGWATLSDGDLDGEIRLTGVKRIDAKLRARARKLFAEALETPGGLKVQTIHAFCTRLLQQFPFEADVAARFQVLEETQQKQMLEEIRMSVLLAAAAKPDSPTGRALATVIPLVSDWSFQLALPEAIREHRRVTDWLDHAGSVENAMAELSHALGIRPEDTIENVERELFDASPVDWPALVVILKQGTKTDREQAAQLEIMRAAAGADRFAALLSVFCTKDGAARANIVTKGLRDKYPELCQRFLHEQKRVCGLLERRLAVINRTRTGALLTIAHEVIKRYRAEKEARGLLDYDDLIAKTRDLLGRVSAAWVHYKLDLGIDHLLIDEAQDTSPDQWDIIERLVAEFAAGAGARGMLRRSIFAVGDDKQSIYSFQGADPSQFHDKQISFGREFEAARMDWRNVRLDYSFRSNASVLGAVQQVFAQEVVYRSMTADVTGISPHLALPDAAPGFVELWEIVKPEERDPVEPWDQPFDKTSETSPRVKLARQIAKVVRLWIERKERVGTGKDRHDVRPGDILVLVRQRGPLFEAIIRALKNENIDVAGADRLVLTDHIAVMDLLALADALLLPDDDLALATILKSPLFGLSEDDLFTLAWDRGDRTLRQALAERRPDLEARLAGMAQDARQLTPFAFYAALLGAKGGRKRFVQRLGLEANDVLDEFLNLALAYETRETQSLHGFIAWLRTASAEIKRDMELARDEVRVMTVHGAKGLEAPIVILADTTTPPEGPIQHHPRLLSLPAERAPPGTPDRLVWMPTKKDDTTPIAAARELTRREAEDEYRRLLYVAMTRAADRLVICGSDGKNRRPDGCWFNLVTAALEPHCVDEPADMGDVTVKRFRKSKPEPEQLPLPGAEAAAAQRRDVPPWLTRHVQKNIEIAAPLSPSQTFDETTAPPADGAARKRALARGVAIHRLLQSLPSIPPEKRADTARRFLANRATSLAADDCAELARKALLLTEDPRFSELFLPGSLAEVPIVGRVALGGHERAVSGVVDRLAITEQAILIADYKSNREVPKRPDEVPNAYLAQLALYRAVLAQLYPGRAVRAALVWTEAPDLMEISGEAMDKALAALAARGNLDGPEGRS